MAAAPHNHVFQLGGAAQKSSEDRMYELTPESESPSAFVRPPQRHSRTLKTYGSTKLRAITSITTAPNRESPRTEASISTLHHLSDQNNHHHVFPTTIDQRTDDARPVPAPSKVNRNRGNKKLSERLPCNVSKEDLERAIAVTPVARRNDRRRKVQSDLPRRPFRWARTPKPHFQEGVKPTAEAQSTSNVLQAEQEGGSQNSAESEESVSLEEALRKGQQQNNQRRHSGDSTHSRANVNAEYNDRDVEKSSQPLPNIQAADNTSAAQVAREGELSKLVREDHEGEESPNSNRNYGQDDLDQELDDIEREILHLGERDSNPTQLNPPQTDSHHGHDSNSRSPKHLRPSPDRNSPDLADRHYNAEDADDEGFEQPTQKKQCWTSRRNPKAEADGDVLRKLKRRRMSKKAKSKPKKLAKPKKKTTTRRLPVDKLVIASERFEDSEDSDIETVNEEPAELPEDPISQLTMSLEESHPETHGKKSFRNLDITLRRGKRVGTIDISDFRMPKVRVGAHQGPPSHSDGFVGYETFPIGKVMSVRKQNRRQQMWNKIAVRMGELTLVAERPSDEVLERQNQARHGNKAVKKPHNRSDWVNDSERHESRATGDAEDAHEDDSMLVDVASEQQVAEEEVSKRPFGDEELLQKRQDELLVSREQTTLQILTTEISVLELPTRSSPLEHKEQRNRTVSFSDETNSSASQVGSIQSRGPIGRSQQPKMISASKKVDKPKKKEIEVPLQLMMVSIPRSSVRHSDSEDSDSEQYEEDEYESEENSDDDEGERSETPEEDSGEEVDGKCEVEAQNEDVEMINQDDGITGSPGLLKHHELPGLSDVEGQILPMKVTVPMLRRQDAQNPIFEISPGKKPTGRQMGLNSTIRRRSSSLQQQQATFSDELPLDKMTYMAVDQPQDKGNSGHVRISGPARENYGDDSWRPREPIPSSVLMEVEDDEILDPPIPVQAPQPLPNDIKLSSRRLSQLASQSSQLVASQPDSPQQHIPTSKESQGSIELGDTQRFVRDSQHMSIPETQFSKPKQEPSDDRVEEGDEDEEEEREVSLSQLAVIPKSSYFERVSQSFQEPVRKPCIVRTNSMPASIHTPRRPEKGDSMAGGISMTYAFQRTISPSRSKSSGGMGTFMSATPGKSLSVLTRQASRGLGTLPTSARRRMVNLPFVPPFKKQ